MTSVETVRTIPLIIEKDIPMEADNIDSGFPFEDRDDDFRSQFDDIASRHPEFAETLEGFPFRSDSLGRRFRNRPSDEEFRRFGGRPFGSRFERFGFPFTRDPFQEETKPEETQQQQQSKPEESPKQESQEEKPKKQNIQQSNTVDLGQKQEPVNDRQQRSMSAPPPDNRQRYTSSIHIPINREGGMGDMGSAQSQPPINKPTERVIPIHVEGRDEPVIPKHTGPIYTQQQQQQPETIFGQRPGQFTQFVGREPPRQYTQGFGPEVKQQKVPQQQQTPPPQQQQPKQQEQQQPPKQEVPPPQQPPKTTTPIDIIQLIQKDVSELMSQVEKFDGAPKDKQYLYLDEMLTRNLIKLDNIDTQGQENIRQARKEAIKCIESCISILEAKAAANVAQTQPSETKVEETQEKMEVEVKEEPKVESEQPQMEVVAPIEPAPVEETKMEVAPVEDKPKETEEEPKESSQGEQETKPKDEEMKEVPEEKKEEEVEKETETKKGGKKKVVKK